MDELSIANAVSVVMGGVDVNVQWLSTYRRSTVVAGIVYPGH